MATKHSKGPACSRCALVAHQSKSHLQEFAEVSGIEVGRASFSGICSLFFVAQRPLGYSRQTVEPPHRWTCCLSSTLGLRPFLRVHQGGLCYFDQLHDVSGYQTCLVVGGKQHSTHHLGCVEFLTQTERLRVSRKAFPSNVELQQIQVRPIARIWNDRHLS